MSPPSHWIRASCEGAPRDLGLDQGRACREGLRADARALGAKPARAWDALVAMGAALAGTRHDAGPRTTRLLARDLARHFPHLEERIAGLATGAGLPDHAVLALLARELDGEGAVGIAGIRMLAGPRLELGFAGPLAPGGLVLRRVVPDGGYAHLGIARPALPAALAGVNERGLAGAALLLAPPGPDEPCAASALLLLDGCIERLDTVEKALEWCERRPGGGRARLVFADASGALGALEVDGEKRQRSGPSLASPDETAGPGAWVRLEPIARRITLGRGAERLDSATL